LSTTGVPISIADKFVEMEKVIVERGVPTARLEFISERCEKTEIIEISKKKYIMILNGNSIQCTDFT
jgi:soluble P-type ATPase